MKQTIQNIAFKLDFNPTFLFYRLYRQLNYWIYFQVYWKLLTRPQIWAQSLGIYWRIAITHKTMALHQVIVYWIYTIDQAINIVYSEASKFTEYILALMSLKVTLSWNSVFYYYWTLLKCFLNFFALGKVHKLNFVLIIDVGVT